MNKEQKTAEELAALVLVELHRVRGCEGVSGLRIAPRGDTWWVPDGSLRTMGAARHDCHEHVPAIVERLRRLYELKR